MQWSSSGYQKHTICGIAIQLHHFCVLWPEKEQRCPKLVAFKLILVPTSCVDGVKSLPRPK